MKDKLYLILKERRTVDDCFNDFAEAVDSLKERLKQPMTIKDRLVTISLLEYNYSEVYRRSVNDHYKDAEQFIKSKSFEFDILDL